MTQLQLDVGISDPFAEPVNEANVTEITKSYPTPNDDHISALKSDPDTINYFDDKFGVGSGVKYLGEVDRAEIPEPPREITTSHVLDVMQGKPSPFEQTWSVIADDEAIKRQKRDVAVIQSMTRAKAYPDRLSSDWVDKEVSNATANYLIMRERAGKEPAKGAKDALDAAEGRYAVARDLQTRVPGWMEKQVNDARARYEKSTAALKKAYESGIVPSSVETEAKVALSIAGMADKVAEDRKTGFERRLGPRERLIIAEKVATAEAEVQYRQDMVDAAKRTPGDDVARAEADLLEAKKQAKVLQDVRDYGEERRPMDDSSFYGEALRGLAKSLTAMPLSNAGAEIGLLGRYFGSETVNDVGGAMFRYGTNLSRDFAARANPSVLELDPSSPTFGSDLKRWLGGTLGEAVGSTVPIVAGFMAGGPWAVAGVGYGFNLNWGEMTNSLDEAFARQGITPDPAKQMAYVATYGTAIGALDNISAIFLVPGMSALVKREAVRAANASMARAFVSGIARGAAMEGLTEGMQQGLEEIGTAFATDQGIDWKEFSKRVIEATAAGTVGGAGFGVMGAPHAHLASRDRASKEEMQKLIRETVGELKIEAEKKAEAEAKKPAGGRKEAPIEGKAKVPVQEGEAVSLPGEPSNISVKATQDQITTDVAEMAASEPMTEAEISRVAEENLPAFHADMVQAFQSEGLEFDLTDGDVRQVSRIMAQGVPAEEAIQRHIAGVSQPEATTKAADKVETEKPVSEAVEAAKQPSEPAAPESTRAMARFNDYLQTGGSLATSAYNEIASYTGIDRKQVGALFQSAEQQGLLKRDRRGRPRRGPALAAASERQEGKAVAATGRSIDPFGAIEASLKQGRTFKVPDRIIDAVHAAQEPMMRAVPANTRVGVLERVEPTDKPNRARYVFRMPDQTNVVVFGRFNEFEGTRAFYLTGRSFRSGNPAILSLTFTSKQGAASPGSFDRRIAGELGHEVVHDLIGQGRLVGSDLFRLIGHAEALKVLDTQLGTHLKMVGDPAYVNAGDYTLREEYTKTYADRANLEKLLSEESATHLVESYIHFVFDPSVSPYTAQDFAPVQDILDNILSGVYAGNAQPRTAVEAGQAAMRSAAEKGTELPDGTVVNGVPLRAIRGYHGTTSWDGGPVRASPEKPFWVSTNKEAIDTSYGDGLKQYRSTPGENPQTLEFDVVADNAKEVTFDELDAMSPAERKAAGIVKIKMSDDVRQMRGDVYAVFDSNLISTPDGTKVKGVPLYAMRSDLDMSPEARKARAKKMGFDTSKVWYHGTTKSFDKFKASHGGELGFGIYLTADPTQAAEYARPNYGGEFPDGANVVPVYVRGGMKQIDRDDWVNLRLQHMNELRAANNGDWNRRFISEAEQRIAADISGEGYGGFYTRNPDGEPSLMFDQAVVFDPSNIRSVNAAFDPSEEGSSNLLYAITAYHGSPHEFIAAISGRTGQMPGGQSRVPSPGLSAPAKALDQIVADLNAALGLTTRHGRLNPGLKAQAGKGGGKLRGQHNVSTGVTRLAVPLDIDTLSHEGGHALEVRFGADLRRLIEAHATELEPLASIGTDKLSEGFAEYFRRYVTNPSAAENAAPTFTNAFDDFIDAAEPGLRDALEQVQVGYQEWIDAPSGGVVASTIKSAQKPTLIKQMITRVQERGFKDVAKTYGDRVYTSLIDDLHPVKVAVDRLVSLAEENIGVALGAGQRIGISAANDAYKLLRLARMGYQGGHVALMEGVKPYHGSEFEGPSWRDAMGTALGGFESEQWSKENMRSFDAYLTSRRMVEEWKRFKTGEITNPPDKISQADHEQSIKDYEEAFPSFVDGAKLLYDYQHNLLKLARDAGFIPKDRFQTYAERKGYYVPVNRVMDDDTVGGGVTQDNARKPGTLGKQFRGSTRDIISPTESIAKFTYELHYLIARNDAISAIDKLALAAGPGGGAIAERIPNSQMRGTSVDAIEVVKQAAKAQGLDDADLVFMIQAIEEKLGEETTATVFKAGEISAAGEPVVYLFENGKRVALRLADGDFGRDMFDAITGMGKEWQGFWTNFLAMPSTLLRAGVTLDPAFLASNFMRDQLATWINSEDFTPFVSGLAGSAEAVESMTGGRPRNLTLANASGMIMGGEGIAALHEARVKRDVEKLRKKGIRVTEAINPMNRKFWELTGITETGTRVGVFRNARLRALNDGLSEYEAIVEAAYAANDIIDFSRHGSKMLVARRLVTFLNAALQGMERSLRTATGRTENPRAVRDLISPYIKSRTGQPLTVLERKRVPVSAKFWAKFASLAIVGIAQSLLYGDDDEYKEIPEYFRNTHWVFKVADGSWIRIPKPFELGAASLMAERSFEAAYKGDEKALERLRGGLFDLVMPPSTVPGLWTAAELWANKSAFTGQQIVPEHLVGLGGELEATAYTSEFSKTFAQWTGVSAAKLDHAILGVSGGLGRIALDASNQALPAIGQGLQGVGMPTLGLPTRQRTALRQGDIPFIKRFTLDPVKSSQSKREFYDRMAFKGGQMTRAADRYKELWDRGQLLEAQAALDSGTENEKVYALIENHGTAADKRMHPMNRARDVISVTRGILTELATGELKKADRTEYSPTERRSIQEMMEMIQMREARNAMVIIREPGYSHLKTLDVEPVLREVETKAPDLFEELDYRLQRKKIQPFSDVASEWSDLKERVLTPGYADDNPPSRAAGRRSGYDVEASP